jgi:hypothetical protein
VELRLKCSVNFDSLKSSVPDYLYSFLLSLAHAQACDALCSGLVPLIQSSDEDKDKVCACKNKSELGIGNSNGKEILQNTNNDRYFKQVVSFAGSQLAALSL